MESCDVIIVGGGPAGSSCAWKLRQLGRDVIVLDKAQFPRHKVCAGWITPPVVDELSIDLDDYRQRLVLQPITQFLTGMIGGRIVETNYDRIVSYGIRRYEFDNYLLQRSGARFHLGTPFRSIRREGSDWIVNDELRAPIVIGAGGHFCPVARHFQNVEKKSQTDNNAQNGPRQNGNHSGQQVELPVVLAQEVEFEMTADQATQCTVQPERPELYFCPDLRGYGWIFRKGNWLNIGLGREGEEHLSSHVQKFVEWLQSQNRIPQITDPMRGHAYHLRTALPQPKVPEGILLIGDAAGLADRQSGEGIRPAIESGLLAAATISELQPAETSRLSQVMARKMHARFAPTTGNWAASLPSSVTQFAASWLMGTRWFSRKVLLDRWFLHIEVPLLTT